MWKISRKQLFILFILLFQIFLNSATIFSKTFGSTELELEFELYYLPLGWYIPFSKKQQDKIFLKKNESIYLHLLGNLLKPKFVVFEISTYPMPVLGILIKKYSPKLYYASKIFDSINIIESLTSSGFKEPWACTFFIGNIVKFVDINNKNNQKFEGKGYSGVIFSYGNYHIKQNDAFFVNWMEFEGKIKGALVDKNRKISVNYKIGGRIFFNKSVKSYIYFGLSRNSLNYFDYGFSFIKNSSYDIKIDYDLNRKEFLNAMFTVGKTFPLRSTKKIIPELILGVIWHFQDLYLNELSTPNWESDFSFIIRPNIRF